MIICIRRDRLHHVLVTKRLELVLILIEIRRHCLELEIRLLLMESGRVSTWFIIRLKSRGASLHATWVLNRKCMNHSFRLLRADQYLVLHSINSIYWLSVIFVLLTTLSSVTSLFSDISLEHNVLIFEFRSYRLELWEIALEVFKCSLNKVDLALYFDLSWRSLWAIFSIVLFTAHYLIARPQSR